MGPTRTMGLATLALFLGACEMEVARGLSETAANEVVVALDGAGILATKDREAGHGETPTYVVAVAEGDGGRALAVLARRHLPRTAAPGLGDVFREGSFVPTATEERARYVAGLSGELAHSLESLEGVLGARVHLALPERASLLDEAPSKARASVLLQLDAAGPPPPAGAVAKLVAGAVEGLAESDVAVVAVPAAALPPKESGLVRMGPLGVTQGSVGAIKAVFGTLLALNLLLAVTLIVVVTRGRRTQG